MEKGCCKTLRVNILPWHPNQLLHNEGNKCVHYFLGCCPVQPPALEQSSHPSFSHCPVFPIFCTPGLCWYLLSSMECVHKVIFSCLAERWTIPVTPLAVLMGVQVPEQVLVYLPWMHGMLWVRYATSNVKICDKTWGLSATVYKPKSSKFVER